MYNKIELIGNLGKDPEVRFTGKGSAVANFPLATSSTWKDANGNRQERTEWHQITVWGKLAEIVGEYGKKGRQVHIEGRIETQKYKDKEGNERYTTKVIAQSVRFLGTRGGAANLTEVEALTNKALATVLDEEADLTQAVTALKAILAICQKTAKQETTQATGTDEVQMTEEQAELERKAQELGIFDSDGEPAPY